MEGDENPQRTAFVEITGDTQPVAELADPGKGNAVAFGGQLETGALANPSHAIGRDFDMGAPWLPDCRPEGTHENYGGGGPAGLIGFAGRCIRPINISRYDCSGAQAHQKSPERQTESR